ncbi:MAG TPA: hypothetical protein VFS43_37000 [Polyangiaceae bacterium]|nr:hypothetical protein [Polyangiaceae bacterium]
MRLPTARVTADRAPVPAVVVVHAAKMKEPWCLATSLAERTAQDVIALYGKRFSIEETFRDEKDIHFGLGLSATHVGSCDRRDRLLLLAAIAHALLTLLGAAAEKVGLDREFQTSPKRGRALSLFGQGTFWYGALPNMKDEKALRLMTAFDERCENMPSSAKFSGSYEGVTQGHGGTAGVEGVWQDVFCVRPCPFSTCRESATSRNCPENCTLFKMEKSFKFKCLACARPLTVGSEHASH